MTRREARAVALAIASDTLRREVQATEHETFDELDETDRGSVRGELLEIANRLRARAERDEVRS